MMQLVGGVKFDLPQIHFRGLPKQALQIALEILAFDPNKQESCKVEIWENEFLSLFISTKPINVNFVYQDENLRAQALFLVNKFLQSRPEFDKNCCYAQVLITAYRIAAVWRGNRKQVIEYLQNKEDLDGCNRVMMIGFLQSIKISSLPPKNLNISKHK